MLGRFLREDLNRKGQNWQHKNGITALKYRARDCLLTTVVLKVQVPGACRNSVLCRRVEASNTLVWILGRFKNVSSV